MGKRTSNGWALRLPNGTLSADSFATTRDMCWDYAFEYLSERLGHEWRSDNWHRWRASIKTAEKLGYKMVKVRLVEGWK